MSVRITVTKALCSLRGINACTYLAGCSTLFHFPPMPMWRQAVSGRSESPFGITAPGRIYYYATLPPTKPKDKVTREDRMVRALDLYARLNPLQQCGLWLLSHVDLEDSNLLWVLIESSSNNGWHYRDAAKRRIPRDGAKKWKDSALKKRYHAQVDTRRGLEKKAFQAVWERWKPELEARLEEARRNNPAFFEGYKKHYHRCYNSRKR